MTNPFTVGQRVAFVNHETAGDPYFKYSDGSKVKVGDVVTVTSLHGDSHIKVTGDTATYHIEWFEPATPARPTIDFGTDSRSTSRQYAAAANSRILDPANQALLKAAAAGETVDALALNAALTEAMSSAATRVGQSMGRRDLTRKIRHLAYITQAVLENHVDQLPAYEQGERSRKVEELSRENSHQTEVSQRLAKDLTEEREARRRAERARDIAARFAADLKTERDENYAQAVEEGATLQATIDGLATSLEYALGLLATVNEAAANQALGFMDAHGIELESLDDES